MDVSRETQISPMATQNFIKSFKSAISKLEIPASEQNLQKIQTHYDLLIKYNRIINLTALNKPPEIAYRLFADSLLPLNFIKSRGNVKILDIGPGGGFPSIPLGVFLDESCHFTLIEKRERVVYYLEELIANLDLHNFEVIHDRTKNLQERFPNHFDIALNKAAFPLEQFLESASQLVKLDDALAIYWASNFNNERQVIHNWNVFRVINRPEKDSGFPGCVMVFQKIES